MFNKLLLLFNTIKYLKFKQIYYRIYYRFRKLQPLSTVGNFAEFVGPFQWQGLCYAPQSVFDDGSARFLNATDSIAAPTIWNDDSKAKLWLYNLHYFDDLNAINSEHRHQSQLRFIHRWVSENPPLEGNGWEPYTLSLRIVNIIKWSGRNNIQEPLVLRSLLQQVDALYHQLEYHIMANHLFANVKALVFAGVYFGKNIDSKYFIKGLSELKLQMDEQFLPDGAHYELSPMYHSVMLWDVLELIDLALTSKHSELLKEVEKWKNIASKGVSWLESMVHPDGGISFFNDAACGIAPQLKKIKQYANKLGVNDLGMPTAAVVCLKNSGFTRVNLQVSDSVLLINHAQILPDYQPGHAHADTLSFELSLMNQRVFVNTGTSQYGLGEERDRQRSTLAHNTLAIDQINSSEVWHGFRVANRASIIEYDHQIESEQQVITIAHDGYKRISPHFIHYRSFVIGQSCIEIRDALAKANTVNAVTRYHLHPDVKLIMINPREAKLQLGNGCVLDIRICGGEMSGFQYDYFPQFGVSMHSQGIEVKLLDDELSFIVGWNS